MTGIRKLHQLRIRLIIALAIFALPVEAPAADLYFMTVYGAQRPIINRPKYTHTWATFIRLSGEGTDPRTYQAQAFTISWLPRTLEVRPLDLRAEPGINLNLQDTIAWCDKNRMEIAQFGPYQITPDLWLRAFRRLDRLESGELQYRASDLINAPRFQEACNCIYAVLDNDNRDPAFRPVTLGFGDIGSAFVARRLAASIIDRRRIHPWVSEMIGVRNYETPGLAVLLGP
jgi:hypothetical protein